MLGSILFTAALLLQGTGTISGVLKTITGRPAVGVRVTAMAVPHSVPGILYTDGSFEIRGVTPGRHIVMMQSLGNSPLYYAALVTIGDNDLEGLMLENIDVWPANPLSLREPTAASASGSFRAPSGLRGRVVEEAGGKPLKTGAVTILGRYMTTTSINADGKFIFLHLLPGSYDLRIESYEHFTLYETVVIGEANVEKEFAIRSSLSDVPAVN